MSFSDNLRKARSRIRGPHDSSDGKKKDARFNCDGATSECCGAPDRDEEESAVKNDVTLSAKAVGSVAARAQAWEKSAATPGYVTIGSVRYGVRFASSAQSKDVVPSRVEASNEKHGDDGEFCCDVMQLAWPRVGGGSGSSSGASLLPPSKIPLPNSAAATAVAATVEKSQAINKRGTTGRASEERAAAPVHRNASEVTRSKRTPVGCFAAGSVESSMKATPPTPNSLRRPAIGRHFGKFGSTASEGDTSKLVGTESKEDLSGGATSQFQLTLDKLHKFRFGVSGSGSGGGSDDKSSTTTPKKKRSGDKAERLRELTDKLLHSRAPSCPDRKKPPICNSTSPKVPNKTQSAATSLRNLFGSTSSLIGSQSHKEEKGKRESVDRDASVDEGGARVECDGGRSSFGGYPQRISGFRSASFSQADEGGGRFSRHGARGKLPSVGSLTFPRVTHVDASTSVSPPPDKVTEKTSSTPSVDSAVGSDEGFVLGSATNIMNISDSHKGARSLTYPFTKKASKSDEMPFSSIDGNGLKSLQQYPSTSRELSDVKEECGTASETSAGECASAPASATPDEFPFELLSPADEPPDKGPGSEEPTLETLEKEINDLIIQQNVRPEIYVTTWPKDSRKKSDSGGRKPYDSPECDTDEGRLREDGLGRNGEKPRLSCQSSDEKDDDIIATKRHPQQQLFRNDSLSEGESDQGDRWRDRTCSPSPLFSPGYDLSDGEGRAAGDKNHAPRRYSKRPLRGPYGQMLEAEMKKPEATRLLSKMQDLKFLEEYMGPRSGDSDVNRPSSESRLTCPRPRFSAGRSLDDSQLQSVYSTNPRNSSKRKVSANLPFGGEGSVSRDGKDGLVVCHQRTTSSPSQLEAFSSSSSAEKAASASSPGGSTGAPRQQGTEATHELLAQLLKGSSERNFLAEENLLTQQLKDTRTHIVAELLETEKSYVESLQILVKKYLQPLKSPESGGLVDASVVDEIFYQIPEILAHHEALLEELKKRLEQWDPRQKIGDVFMDTFTRPIVIETYTSFINNWKTAKEAIRTTCQQKPSFARFLEAMAREHKGKLALDSLIIMPVQRIPRYELLIQRLLKHTDSSHPDHALLLAAQLEVHELAVKINLSERETLEIEQQQQTLRDLEALIEGLVDLTSAERVFVRHDTVTMVSGQGTRKERALFLFSDILIITSIKRRSGTIRKPSTTGPGSVTGALDANKYKLLMRIPIDDLEIVKTKDENLKRVMKEMEKLTEDVATLTQINELTSTLHFPHSALEEVVKEMLLNVNKQLAERQTSDSQLSYLELMLNTQNGVENLSVVFTKPDKRASWEDAFTEWKQKFALSAHRKPAPEFVASVPIRKTRAGLQFTCAAPTLGLNSCKLRDVWVCNSDGYVGQVCVLSLQPEPTVTSCNGVCNARILCVASIPAECSGETCPDVKSDISISVEDADGSGGNIDLVSSSSSDDDEGDPDGGDKSEKRRSRSEPIGSDVSSEETDTQQPTMWLGTEDGNIHVYNCSDNIRIKKNKVKIQHGCAVHCIIYLDNRVFVALGNGDIAVYVRDQSGGWNTSDPYAICVGTGSVPVTKMTPVSGKLWCGCLNTIRILNTSSLKVEHSFQISGDNTRRVSGMAVSGLGVWISLQNSAVIRLFHSNTYENLYDVNVAPAVTKMLAGCDDIIRQHKAACLRVTALLACKDLLWIGTSAGVVLTMTLPHVAQSTSKLNSLPNVSGLPHGHTGHVRFLTCVETCPQVGNESGSRPGSHHHHHHHHHHHRYSMKGKIHEGQSGSGNASSKLLVISGGDGYEDFRNSSVSEIAGREDSTNHLLLWHI